MADPTRHVTQDLGWWPSVSDGTFIGSAEYRPDCHDENISCLSVLGVFFTIVFTYSGFVLLAVGTFWNANIVSKLKKIKEQWRKLRAKA
jgi:hypothetical protein